MKNACVALAVTLWAASALAQINAVPFIQQPLVPTSIKPGSAAFTLTVNGAGFGSGSVVNWNGSPRDTTFVSPKKLMAAILASDVVSAGTASITVSNPLPGGGVSNVDFFQVVKRIPTIVMSEKTLGGDSSATLAADFNRDGQLDLAWNGGQPQVLLNLGDGIFEDLPPIKTTCPAEGLVAADFNGDGILDLLCPPAAVFLGNGDGTFQSPIDNAVAGIDVVYAIAAGDLNHDGFMDVAMAGTDDIYTDAAEVAVAFGNGDGTFQVAKSYPLGTLIDGGMSFAAGDFNNDGQLDLAVASVQSNSVNILLNDGTGVFRVLPALTAQRPVSLAAADFGLDGNLDLAVGSGSSYLYVFPGNGDGTFGTAAQYRVAVPSSGGIALGDFNGDGALDIAIATWAEFKWIISLFPGRGDGTFVHPINFNNSAFETVTLLAGDFNGDGSLDLAVGGLSGPANIFFQEPSSATASPFSLTFPAQQVGTTSSAQQVQLTNTGETLIKIAGIHTKGDFSQTNNCGSTLPVSGYCTVSVVFAPTATGKRNGQLTFGDTAMDSPQIVSLSGTGTN